MIRPPITMTGLGPVHERGWRRRSAGLRLGDWRTFGLSLVACLCSSVALIAADALPAKPSRYFNDYARVVPAASANRLNETLASFERSNSVQLVVAIFDRLPAGAVLEDFTVRTAQSWGVGQKATDNGAVLFVFIQDRALRIEVGYGLEGALPDALARRIIDNEIVPRFRQGGYEAGITAGVTSMMQAVRGEYRGTGRTVGDTSVRRRNPVPWIVPILFLFAIITFFRRIGTVFHHGRHSHWGGGWSSGSSGGGFSGGSGFSGGGGGFGGGGASGRW